MRFLAAAALGLALLGLGACTPPMKEYAYPAWGFAAAFQSDPVVTDEPASADGSRPHTLLVEASSGGRDFAVTATDASQASNSPDEMLSQAPQLVANSMGGTVDTTTYVATGAVVGREVRINKAGKPMMVLRVFVSNGRLYQVGAASVLGLGDPAVKTFLDSFRLTAK